MSSIKARQVAEQEPIMSVLLNIEKQYAAALIFLYRRLNRMETQPIR
jgi:hypothetical protein